MGNGIFKYFFYLLNYNLYILMILAGEKTVTELVKHQGEFIPS